MTPLAPSPLFLSVFAGASFLLTGFVHSQTIQLDVLSKPGDVNWYSVDNIADATTGAPLLGGSGHVMCLEYWQNAPTVGNTYSYDVTTGSDLESIFYIYPEAASRGADLINWLVDAYYQQTFLDVDPHNDGAAYFFGTVQEIVFDFDGTLASLSGDAGNMQFGDTPTLSGLTSNFASIPVGFRAEHFDVTFLNEPTDTTQNMMFITPVPEPSGVLLGGLGAMFLLTRRGSRRGQKRP